MQFANDLHVALIADADAGITWVSGTMRWRRLVIPAVMAAFGVACVAAANTAASQGTLGTQPLWWLGVLAIFTPAAATLLFVRLSRNEAVSILLLVGFALYAVKLLYAPGMMSGYDVDELLHYRTVDNLLATGHLFTHNSLLPVSPYYPGMEAVTGVIVQLTGMSITQSGLVLIGIARLLTVLSVFLLLERIAMPSRFAAPATLLYMACPPFLYFDTMFAYESLALALALACLFVLRAAQLDEGERRYRLNVVGAILLLAVVVTHHVTSFILAATLVLWSLVELYGALHMRSQPREAVRLRGRAHRVYLRNLPGGGWVPVLGVAAVLVWLFNVAEITISYLRPPLVSGFAEVTRMILLQGTGRKLFESAARHSASLLERAVGIGSVLIILVLIPLGARAVWTRRNSSVLSRFLVLGSLAYLAILALRFTRSGWDVGSRATAYIYVPLAFTITAGIELLIARYVRRSWLRAVAIVVAVSVIFAGGIVAGTEPWTRQPTPYDPGVAQAPHDAESLAAANWAATTLGPGHRFAADSAGGTLIGSIGRQRLVTSDDGVWITELFLTPGFDATARAVVQKGRIDYVLVDQRIAGVEPLKGFIYGDYASSVSSTTVNKFDILWDASRVFDSGSIQFFDLHRLTP